MKQHGLMTLSLITMVILIGASAGSGLAAPPGKEMAVVDLQDKTHLGKTVLQGKYIFVHDDSRMAKDEACFYVYEYAAKRDGASPKRGPRSWWSHFTVSAVTHPQASQIVLTYGMTARDSSSCARFSSLEALKGTASLESLPRLWALATRVKRGAWRERTEGGEPLPQGTALR